MDKQLKANLTSSSLWIRVLYMLLFACVLYVSLAVMWVCVFIQFVISLITGSTGVRVACFSSSLSLFIYQTIRFLTFGTEEKPFPFADWPECDKPESDEPEAEDFVETSVTSDIGAGEVIEQAPETTADESQQQEKAAYSEPSETEITSSTDPAEGKENDSTSEPDAPEKADEDDSKTTDAEKKQ